jgi:hypothetical protein
MKGLLGKMKPGFYEPRTVKKGVEETSLKIKEGGIYWWVSDGQGGGYDVEKELDAIILSRLIRIEAILTKNFKRLV